jgi:hypothetical protein
MPWSQSALRRRTCISGKSRTVDKIDLFPKYLATLQPIIWRWERSWMESSLLELGLEMVSRNDTWTRYHFPEDDISGSLLCHGERVVRLEIFVEVNEELGNLRVYRPSRYNQVRDQVFQDFDEKFERAQTHARAILGPPGFQGSWEDSLCPDRIVNPIRITAWDVAGGQLMLEYQHEDPELPLIISIVVQPREN